MISIKDTERSCVRRAFDGQVHKAYRGRNARQRMENEIRVLEHLQNAQCPFVPRLISIDRTNLAIVQSSCGVPVQQMDEMHLRELFDSLREYGVEHGDCELRNVTYCGADGRFCIVDFELATILDPDWEVELRRLQNQIDTLMWEGGA